MDLILPDYGLLFWTGLVFCLLLFLLAKFAWKPILNAVNAREQKIHEALELADKTRAEMLLLQAENEKILKEARAERDAIMNDAKETALGMVEAAKNKAKEEANKIVESAKAIIASEKSAAIRDLKNQLAGFSIDIAEKIVRTELSTDSKQKALAEKLADDINMN
ncbi:MAG: F0F1 ATP synthase subunit B [Flavobacteriia bacterium]|nr:F0F1 ATP synthase subunit B [Flavobacteriia bacterium]